MRIHYEPLPIMEQLDNVIDEANRQNRAIDNIELEWREWEEFRNVFIGKITIYRGVLIKQRARKDQYVNP